MAQSEGRWGLQEDMGIAHCLWNMDAAAGPYDMPSTLDALPVRLPQMATTYSETFITDPKQSSYQSYNGAAAGTSEGSETS